MVKILYMLRAILYNILFKLAFLLQFVTFFPNYFFVEGKQKKKHFYFSEEKIF